MIVPVREPMIVPVLEPIIVPLREPIMVPVLEPALLDLDPMIVPPNETVANEKVKVVAIRIRLSFDIVNSPGKSCVIGKICSGCETESDHFLPSRWF